MSYGVRIAPRIMPTGATQATITLEVSAIPQMIAMIPCVRGVMRITLLTVRIAIVLICMVVIMTMTKM
jgi:hypothetical protein